MGLQGTARRRIFLRLANSHFEQNAFKRHLHSCSPTYKGSLAEAKRCL